MFYDCLDLKDNDIILKLVKTVDAIPEKKWVPAYYFDVYLFDGTKVGSCDLRVGHNENTYIGGNIGYKIGEPYRGHRYAAKAVILLLKLAKKHDLKFVYVTCSPTNIASSKTCEIAGGKLIEKTKVPEDNDLYKEQGLTEVLVYKFEL